MRSDPCVAVIGAGVTGLTAAYRIAAACPWARVIVFEQSDRVGGKLYRRELGGQLVDVGAESMLVRRPEGLNLIADLGLSGERVAPLTTVARLWVGGAARPIPGHTVMGIPADVAAVAATGVLSDAGVQRLRAEPDAHRAPLTEDISVGALVADRLGQEVVDRLVEPLLGGVYAGRAEEISLRAAIPALATQLAQGGSLLKAAAAVSAAARTRFPADAPVFTSLAGGLGRLTDALAVSGGFDVRTGAAVRRIERGPDGGFVLAVGARPVEELQAFDAVVVATPAAKAATLLADLAPIAARELGGVRTASVAIVSFAFPSGADLPAGSGLLIPAVEGHAVKGITVTSQKWPGTEPAVVLVRASLGRMGEEAVLQRDDAELAALARRDLRAMLGLADGPVDTLVTRWGGGLPQYDVGHLDRISRVRADVAAVPGLAVAGASYDGIGIPACIASAGLAADRVVAFLGARVAPDA